jgi:hypothetical protein
MDTEKLRGAPDRAGEVSSDFRVFDRNDGHHIGTVKTVGGRFVARDVSDRVLGDYQNAISAIRALEQAETDASWRAAFAKIESEQTRNTKATPAGQQDANFGWGAVIAAERRQRSTSWHA